MSGFLSVADITSYLLSTDWLREPEPWLTASIWSSPDGHQVFVPARDGMGDGDLRVREILDVLAQVEARPAHDIAVEISSPLMDMQTYRLSGDDLLSSFTTLPSGVRALNGIRQLLDAAGRALVEGPHVAFRGGSPRTVREVLGRTRLVIGSTEAYAFTIHVPVDGPSPTSADSTPAEPPLARAIVVQLLEAVRSANGAAVDAYNTDDLSRFDDVITAGVSANLCQALSELGGPDHRQPFEINFTWARGLPSGLPPTIIRMDADRGVLLAAAARHLRALSTSGEAIVTGVIESLHDDTSRGDRWRVKVRGEVAGSRGVGSRRTLWVRLDGQSAYDLAITAHRERRPVRAQGIMSILAGRLELLSRRSDFTLG